MIQMSSMIKDLPKTEPVQKKGGGCEESAAGFFEMLDDQMPAMKPEVKSPEEKDVVSKEQPAEEELVELPTGSVVQSDELLVAREIEVAVPQKVLEPVVSDKMLLQEQIESPAGDGKEELPENSELLPVGSRLAGSPVLPDVKVQGLPVAQVPKSRTPAKAIDVTAKKAILAGENAPVKDSLTPGLAGAPAPATGDTKPVAEFQLSRSLMGLVPPTGLQKMGRKGDGQSAEMLLGSMDRVNLLSSSPKVAVPAPDAASMAGLMEDKAVRFEALVDRFDQRMLSMVQRNDKVMRITVQPESMGRLTVLCQQTDSTISIEIHAQSSAVQDLISQQEASVRRLMQSNNLELGRFDVFQDQGSSKQRSGWAEPRKEHGIHPAFKQEDQQQELGRGSLNGALSWIA